MKKAIKHFKNSHGEVMLHELEGEYWVWCRFSPALFQSYPTKKYDLAVATYEQWEQDLKDEDAEN